MRRYLNLRLARQVVDDSTTGAFEVAASGFGGAVTYEAAETPSGYTINSNGVGDLASALTEGTKVVYVRVEDADGYAIGMKFTLVAPEAPPAPDIGWTLYSDLETIDSDIASGVIAQLVTNLPGADLFEKISGDARITIATDGELSTSAAIYSDTYSHASFVARATNTSTTEYVQVALELVGDAADPAWWINNSIVDVDYENDRARIGGVSYTSIADARTAAVIVQSGGIDRIPLGALGLGTDYTIAGKGVTAATTVGATPRYLVTVDDGADGNPTDHLAALYQGLVSSTAYMTGLIAVSTTQTPSAPSFATLSPANSTAVRAAMRVKANDFAISVNGSAAQTDNAGSIPTVTQLVVGDRDDATRPWSGTVHRVALINANVSNTDIANIFGA